MLIYTNQLWTCFSDWKISFSFAGWGSSALLTVFLCLLMILGLLLNDYLFVYLMLAYLFSAFEGDTFKRTITSGDYIFAFQGDILLSKRSYFSKCPTGRGQGEDLSKIGISLQELAFSDINVSICEKLCLFLPFSYVQILLDSDSLQLMKISSMICSLLTSITSHKLCTYFFSFLISIFLCFSLCLASFLLNFIFISFSLCMDLPSFLMILIEAIEVESDLSTKSLLPYRFAIVVISFMHNLRQQASFKPSRLLASLNSKHLVISLSRSASMLILCCKQRENILIMLLGRQLIASEEARRHAVLNLPKVREQYQMDSFNDSSPSCEISTIFVVTLFISKITGSGQSQSSSYFSQS